MDVIELIQFRNRCLSRIRQLSLAYLESELAAKAEDALFDFEKYQSERDACCRALELMDRKITEAAQRTTRRDSQIVAEIQSLSAEGENTIRDILKTDEVVFARVEEIKNKVTNQIHETKKGQKVVGRFRSLWVPAAGGSLDGKA